MPELSANTIKDRPCLSYTPELSLLSKLDRVTKLKLGRGATAGSNLERCQGTKGDLHVKVSSDIPHIQMETSAEC